MVPVVLAGLGALSLGFYAKKKGLFSFGGESDAVAQHEALYHHALNVLKDPNEIRAVGHAFKANGDSFHGDILLKRASIAQLPKAVKKARTKAIQKAISECKDPDKLERFAAVLESEGCTGAATSCRQVASSLRNLPSLSVR